MSKILITGAAGFIGRALAKRLLEQGEDLVLVDSLNNYYSPQLKRDRINTLMVGSKVKFFYADITNTDYLNRLFKENDINTVVHLAAQPGITTSVVNPGKTFKNNVEGTANVLDACARHGIKRIFLASSSSVYGSDMFNTINAETDSPAPQNNYAISKLTNEMQAKLHHTTYGGTMASMRFFTTYGPWGRPDMACWLFTEAMLNNRPIIIRGEQTRRDFVYIDDLVTMITSIMEHTPPDRLLTYNLGSGRSYRVVDMVNCIGSCLGIPPNFSFLELPDYEMTQTCADMIRYHNKIAALPNFKPLAEGVEEFVKWYKEYNK